MGRAGAYLALLGGVTAISTSAIFVKLAQAPSGSLAFYRLAITLVLLLPAAVLRRECREELRQLSGRDLVISLGSGILLAVHYVLWFESLNFTNVASSTVLVTLQPLYAMAISRLVLREHQTRQGLAGCAIALAGSVYIGLGDLRLGGTALLGDLMAFLAAGMFSLYFFIGQAARQRLSALVYSVVGYSGSVVFLALYVLWKGEPLGPFPLGTWLCFAGIALVPTILGQFVFNILLKWIPATTVSMSVLGEPVGTCILAWALLGEGITLRQAVGMAVILGGLALYFRAPPPRREGD